MNAVLDSVGVIPGVAANGRHGYNVGVLLVGFQGYISVLGEKFNFLEGLVALLLATHFIEVGLLEHFWVFLNELEIIFSPAVVGAVENGS